MVLKPDFFPLLAVAVADAWSLVLRALSLVLLLALPAWADDDRELTLSVAELVVDMSAEGTRYPELQLVFDGEEKDGARISSTPDLLIPTLMRQLPRHLTQYSEQSRQRQVIPPILGIRNGFDFIHLKKNTQVGLPATVREQRIIVSAQPFVWVTATHGR